VRLVEDGAVVPLPGSDAQVGELRGEFDARLVWQALEAHRLEGGLAYERSRIEVDGDARAERRLGFLKPSAAWVWEATPRTQLRLGMARTVGQLDFDGFAASGELIDERPISGNAELRPAVTDSASLRIDQRLPGDGTLALTLKRERIGDALTFVPLASGGEALLNFGDVDLTQAAFEANLPLDRWLANARLEFSTTITRASRPDPIGGRRDDFRDFREAALSFRHDLPAYRAAYGFVIEDWTPERTWYRAEYDELRETTWVVAFVESTALPGIKTTLTLSGLTGWTEERERTFFSPDRAGTRTGREFRVRRLREPFLNLLFERQF
jgi:hypothetical protein